MQSVDASRTAASAPFPDTSPDLSALVIGLLKGVLYQDNGPALWHALLRLQARVRDYVAVPGLGNGPGAGYRRTRVSRFTSLHPR